MTGWLRGVFSKCLHSLKFIDCCEASEKNFFHIKLRKVACRVDVGCVWEYVCLSFYSSNVCLSKVTRASVSSARHWLLYRIIGHGWFILLGHLDDVQGFFRTKLFYLLPFFPSSLQIYEWKRACDC